MKAKAPRKKGATAGGKAAIKPPSAAKGHAVSVHAWGMPYSIPKRERFSLKVGMRCSSGCNLAGRAFRIVDHTGAQLAAGKLGDEVWPRTSALHYAEVQARGSSSLGDHTWKVELPAFDAHRFPHPAATFAFAAKVVDRPDHSVTIEVVDHAKRTPIRGIHILLHPYRAVTDENGVAHLRVADGRYPLHISGFKYVPYDSVVEAVEDVKLRAELMVEPPPSPFYPKPLEE